MRKQLIKGHIDAQCALGFMYDEGKYFLQNYKEAVKWYTKAAEQGNVDAQYYLGKMYELGKGVEQNYQKAIEWYTKSAKQGNGDAQLDLANIYEKKETFLQNYEEAFKWYSKAAEQSIMSAKCRLACMHAEGRGTKLDHNKAIEILDSIDPINNFQKRKVDKARTTCENIKIANQNKKLIEEKYQDKINNLKREIRFSSFLKFVLSSIALALGLFYVAYNLGLLDFYFVAKQFNPWCIIPVSAILFWLLFNLEKKLTQLRKMKTDYEFKLSNYVFYKNCKDVKTAEGKFLSEILQPIVVESLKENPIRTFDKSSNTEPNDVLVLAKTITKLLKKK